MSRTNRVRWLETAAWTAGTLLIATYAGTRWWYAHGRDVGVAAFEAARSEMQRSPSRPAAFEFSADQVDMSMWSPARVERYRKSVRAVAVPQALLRIPAVKLAVPVFDGTSDQNLNRGAGRIEGTAHIGGPGNVGIAAHRDGSFRALENVRIGDLLLLERVTAIDTYRVVSTTVVNPSEVSVLQPTSIRSVTLVTCYPFYYVGSAPRRFIVHAQYMTSKETPASEATLSDAFDTTSATQPRRASESR